LERGKKPGGLVNTFWHEGFAFDGEILEEHRFTKIKRPSTP
jgi:hypothetical protein